MPTKVCTKCGETKPVSEFSKHKDCKYGVQACCKACDAEYYLENKGHIIERNTEYYHANKDQITNREAEYRQRNRERFAERSRKYYAENKDRINERIRNREALKRSAQGKHTVKDIQSQLELQDGYCAYCEADLEQTGYHVDHIRPLSRGGRNDIINLVCACPTCNTSKKAKTLPEWFARLEATNRLTDTLATNIIAVHEQWLQDHSDSSGQLTLFD